MKMIFSIAKAELQKLFYSPIAWLVLVLFGFQAALFFYDIFDPIYRNLENLRTQDNVTWQLFLSSNALLRSIPNYIYLYIPILSMGILSREISTGSIKLLFSSPLTTRQIVWGKYLALIVFGLLMILLLVPFIILTYISIDNIELPVLFAGLLGLFLLICTYAAIGLFVSSLTSYAVVAAIGTMAILAFLNYINKVGQETAFVRDITYWLSISGRSNSFLNGMITSHDLIYFIAIIGLFVSITILRLQSTRVKYQRRILWFKYLLIFSVVILIGYFTSLPVAKKYVDLTFNKRNTLVEESQKIVHQIKDKLTITTYANMLSNLYSVALPDKFKQEQNFFERYTRFKPDIELKYVYYYHHNEDAHINKRYPELTDKQKLDSLIKQYEYDFKIVPYSEISHEVDLSGENYETVRVIKTSNGRQTFLRYFKDMMFHPGEAEISIALKRLTNAELPVVGFVTGHGERSLNDKFDRGYKLFSQESRIRYSLVNQGFNFTETTLSNPVADSISILLIAESKTAYSDHELQNLEAYINKGGNLLIAGEPGRHNLMNVLTRSLGVRFMEGTVVCPSKEFQPEVLKLTPVPQADSISYHLKEMREKKNFIIAPTSGALEIVEDRGYEVIPIFVSDSAQSWIEKETTNFVDDPIVFNEAVEKKHPYLTVVGLTRNVGNKKQKIIITGDADWMSNIELSTNRNNSVSGNLKFIAGAFSWLSDGIAPIDDRRFPVKSTTPGFPKKSLDNVRLLLKWIIPVSLALGGTILLMRRKSR